MHVLEVRRLVEQVIVHGGDVDVARLQRRDDRVDLAIQEHEVAVRDRVVPRAPKRGPAS